MKNIAIFASGSGTNAENIIKYFQKDKLINVVGVICNKPHLGAELRAFNLDIPVFVFSRKLFYQTSNIVDILKFLNTDIVVLAGFLWLVPDSILHAYDNKIINIHPALLPKYGGKGMYGDNVHNAVVANKESHSGITIHLVNEHYDEGKIIFQATCEVKPTDSAKDVATKVHALEYEHFPRIIEEYIKSL